MGKPGRLPNGFGSITKLTGKRRHPYMARPPIRGYTDDGKQLQSKPIGYFKTYWEAYNALEQYNAEGGHSNLGFSQVFEEALAEHSDSVSAATVSSLRTGYKNLSAFHDKIFTEIRTRDIQGAIDTLEGKRAKKEQALNTLRMMYRYSLKYEITEKDYSQGIRAGAIDTESAEPFTLEEIEKLKAHKGVPEVDMVLIMIYSGFRVSAYRTLEVNAEEGYFRGGVKTAAGKGRTVPIHSGIEPLLPHYIKGTHRDSLRRAFAKAMEVCGILGKTPHSTRHTFSYLCDKYGVDEYIKRFMMGHRTSADVTAIYRHTDLERMKEEIEKVPF